MSLRYMRDGLTFFSGVVVGLFLYFMNNYYQKWDPATRIEKAIAYNLYMNLNRYKLDQKDCIDLSRLFAEVNRIILDPQTSLSEEESIQILSELAVAKAKQIAALNLEQSEKRLSKIRSRAITVVEDRVYIEILYEGEGSPITIQDKIAIQFKEYSPNGLLLKDTTELGSFTINLSETIKGFQLGLAGARIGERRKLYIHPEYGFGQISDRGGNQLLIYEVTVLALSN